MSFGNPYMNGYQMQAPVYQPPMQDRLAQLQNQYQAAVPQPQAMQIPQNTQQPLQMQYIQQQQMTGRYVNDFSDITANDVPMDGRWAIFAKNDMSEIQARAWSPEGKIVPVVFKPVIEENNEKAKENEKLKIDLSDETTQAFMKRFDDISDRLEKVEKTISKQPSTTSRTRKGADADE